MIDRSVETSAPKGVALSYHQYLAAMECLTSSEAKRRWRQAIKAAWGNRCCFCGEPPIDDKSLTIDHLKAKSRGGEDTSNNCLPACLEHNQSKGSSDWVEWFRAQAFHSLEREARIRFWLENGRLPDGDEWASAEEA
jgi:hypothetical protein